MSLFLTPPDVPQIPTFIVDGKITEPATGFSLKIGADKRLETVGVTFKDGTTKHFIVDRVLEGPPGERMTVWCKS